MSFLMKKKKKKKKENKSYFVVENVFGRNNLSAGRLSSFGSRHCYEVYVYIWEVSILDEPIVSKVTLRRML